MFYLFAHNKFFIVLILFIYLNLTMYGCSSSQGTGNNKGPIKISRIETIDGKIVEFWNSKLGYAVMGDNEIIYIKKNGNKITFPIKDVKKLYINNESGINSTGIIIAGAFLICVLAAVMMTPLGGSSGIF